LKILGKGRKVFFFFFLQQQQQQHEDVATSEAGPELRFGLGCISDFTALIYIITHVIKDGVPNIKV
jgi:hypothetical protein